MWVSELAKSTSQVKLQIAASRPVALEIGTSGELASADVVSPEGIESS